MNNFREHFITSDCIEHMPTLHSVLIRFFKTSLIIFYMWATEVVSVGLTALRNQDNHLH